MPGQRRKSTSSRCSALRQIRQHQAIPPSSCLSHMLSHP
ncbi:hypothetical protein NC652_026891 [Populus alba x Populus x berolinensis]|nr:hypothetical protein NC652_026891 [Populus alba x Populus x berolinensis]